MSITYPTPKFDAAVAKILTLFIPPEHNGFQLKGGPKNGPGENAKTFIILTYCASIGATVDVALSYFHEHLDYVIANKDTDDHHNLRALKALSSYWLKQFLTLTEKVLELSQAETIIHTSWEDRANITMANVTPDLKLAVEHVISRLNNGELRVATQQAVGQWKVNQWIKKAVLLSFRLKDNSILHAGDLAFYDKVDSKFAGMNEADFKAMGARIVPPAVARRGSYIAKGAILMPSFVNIGAYVDEGTMVDAWATVGSCAQIGKHVHLSGGVGIGGVLEPMQANPTIIEDNCFIGARSEVVEGVIVEENSVLGMGVYIGQSTPIYDRELDTITYGRVPSGSVVVSGTLPKAGGKYSLYAAIIVKKVDAQTRSKTSINDLLRD
jgi:2,3,4,5-tetrahydropyridine-2-carboxylate N-succinyltransferase